MTLSDATPESWDQLDELEDDSPAEPAEDQVPEEGTEPQGEAEEAEPEAEPDAEGDPESLADDTGATEAEPGSEGESPSPEDAIAAEAEPTETPETPVETEVRPFKFRADGAEVEVPIKGVKIEDEEAFRQSLQPYLANRASWDRERDRLRRQVEELDPERNEAVVRARTFMETMDPLLEAAEKGDTGPLYEWLEDVTKNSAVLRARAEAAVAKAQAEPIRRERDEQQQAQEWEERVPALKAGIRENAEKILGLDEFKGLGLKADDELVEEVWALFEQGAPVFVEVTEETQQRYGVPPGVYVNNQYLQAHLRPTAKRLRADRQRREAAAAAAKANDKALGKGQKKPPTTAPAKGGGTPERDEPVPTTKEEWIESLR